MNKEMVTDYNDDAIQVLEGLEAVRKRPGMYIGSTDQRGLHHLVNEILDNAVDEALAGYGQRIEVSLHADGSVSIRDEGRGIPTGIHRLGKPTPEVIFTVLHAGGKFGQGGYSTSGGLHGVGASVVNALSEWLEVEIYRHGKIHRQRFENGGQPVTSLEVTGKTNKTGTLVRFKPDPLIFGKTAFQFESLAERCREAAFLLKGLTIEMVDVRKGDERREIYHYDKGIQAFVEYINSEKDVFHPVIYFRGSQNDFPLEIAFQYHDGVSENMLSFVNHVRTRDGGTHEAGFKTAMTRAINEYARKTKLLKEKDKNLEGSDIREGLTAIVSIRIPEEKLQFEGQTKGKLGSPEARSAVDAFMSEQLTIFLEENPDVATTIVKKSIRAAQAREAARKAREEARTGKKGRRKEALLSGKLTPAGSKDPSRNELFLVEGDSAGGSAKQGRDRQFQAILPLRGKVINAEKAKLEDILKNEEIRTIIYTLGGGVGADFNLDECHYDKVIIMTDADTDGAHIQVLLLTFFYRYMRPLVEAGKIYIALPPLYKISRGSGKKAVEEYAWDEQQLRQALKKMGKGCTIQRYKGLGEMNADQLWETTMNPETRSLIRVNIEDAARAERRVSILMGDRVEPRREWIERHVSFTLEDDQELLMNQNLEVTEEAK